jgi:hypothetical protein
MVVCEKLDGEVGLCLRVGRLERWKVDRIGGWKGRKLEIGGCSGCSGKEERRRLDMMSGLAWNGSNEL